MPDEFPNELKRWVHTSPSRCWWAHSLGESPGECSTNHLAPLRLERFVGHLGALVPRGRLAFLYPCVRKNSPGEVDVGVLTVQQGLSIPDSNVLQKSNSYFGCNRLVELDS